MSYSSKDMEFEATDADLKLTTEGTVERCILETDDFESGQIFFKPRYEEEEEVETSIGIEGTQTKEKKYAPSNLPEEIIELLQLAKERESLTCTATVTKKDQGDESIYFVNKWDIDSLESRLLQDKGGSQA